MIVLDASVVIAVFDPGDLHHDRAAEFLESNAGGGFAVHPMTLAESLVGAAKVGRPNQVRRQMRNMGIEVFVPDTDEPLLVAEIRANTSLKLPDCCVVSAALSLSVPLITFDERLRSAARAHSVVVVDSLE